MATSDLCSNYSESYSLPSVLLSAKGVAVGDGPLLLVLLAARGTLVAVLTINTPKSPVKYHTRHYLNV